MNRFDDFTRAERVITKKHYDYNIDDVEINSSSDIEKPISISFDVIKTEIKDVALSFDIDNIILVYDTRIPKVFQNCIDAAYLATGTNGAIHKSDYTIGALTIKSELTNFDFNRQVTAIYNARDVLADSIYTENGKTYVRLHCGHYSMLNFKY